MKNILEELVSVSITTLLLFGIVLFILDFTSAKPEKQIMCFEKEVYVLGKGNVSCILCKDVTDNYMSCDYDSVNRSLKGVFYR